MVLASVIRRNSSEAPDEPAVIDASAGPLSWRALAERMQVFAGELERVAGSPLVLLLPERADSVALLAAFDVSRRDAILASARLGAGQARQYLRDFGAAGAVALTDAGLEVLATAEADRALRDSEASEVSVYVLTSGTTARPRCARHTWPTLAGAVKRNARYQGTRWLGAYPLSRFSGLQVLTQCLWNRATLVIPADFSPAAASAALREHGVQYLCCTPTYLRHILLSARSSDWRQVRLEKVTLGGEIVEQSLLDALFRVLPDVKVTHTYGSTEVGCVLLVHDGKAGFDPAQLDGQRLKLVDQEIHVRRTTKAMHGYLGEAAQPEWVPTGDIVEVGPDRVRFLGRKNDVINVGGFKVNPTEVEAVIREVAGVVEACVVAHASSISGNLVKALLVVDAAAQRDAVQREVLRRCSDRLPAYMVPRLFEFPEHIDRTATNKLVRRRSDDEGRE